MNKKIKAILNKKEAPGPFRKLDEHIFLLDYKTPYHLDWVLENGLSNTGDMVKLAQSKLGMPEGGIKEDSDGFACSTFNAFNTDGDHLLARNFDYKDSPTLVYWTSPENGYKSVAITSVNVMLYGYKHQIMDKHPLKRTFLAPYTCMDGINEKGLAIAVLEIKAKATKQETGKKPLVTTAMIRAVLDKCATVDEALEMFNSYDMHDLLFCNYHYQICDAEGNSVIIEYVNNEMRIFRPEDKIQYLMNFYLSEDGDNSKGFGYERRDVVENVLKQTGGVMDKFKMIDTLEKCLLYYKHERGYMITTLWSAAYNCSKKTVTLAGGMDYENLYEFSATEPMKITKVRGK